MPVNGRELLLYSQAQAFLGVLLGLMLGLLAIKTLCSKHNLTQQGQTSVDSRKRLCLRLLI